MRSFILGDSYPWVSLYEWLKICLNVRHCVINKYFMSINMLCKITRKVGLEHDIFAICNSLLVSFTKMLLNITLPANKGPVLLSYSILSFIKFLVFFNLESIVGSIKSWGSELQLCWLTALSIELSKGFDGWRVY